MSGRWPTDRPKQSPAPEVGKEVRALRLRGPLHRPPGPYEVLASVTARGWPFGFRWEASHSAAASRVANTDSRLSTSVSESSLPAGESPITTAIGTAGPLPS